jgi:hypothetical protein
VTDKTHKPAIEFYINICKLANMQEATLNNSFCSLSQSNRKSRLHGWKILADFCAEQGMDAVAFATEPNPVLMFSDLVTYMKNKNIPDHLRLQARPAVQQLLDLLNKNVNLAKNSFSASLFRNNTSTTPKGPAYTTIYKLDSFLKYITSLFPPDALPWPKLMGIAAAVFMVFIPCRTIALIRIDPSQAVFNKVDNSCTVLAKEKTDAGNSKSKLWIREVQEQSLSPQYYFKLLYSRAKRLQCPKALFCSDRGRPYTRTDSIAKALVALLREAGIPPPYKSNSLRHATITSLFAAGLDEKQVNAYSGHSNNYHTALKFYNHLDLNWAGAKLVPIPESAAKMIVDDGDEIDEE